MSLHDFGALAYPVGRKEHRCEFCHGPIPLGEKHVQFKGVWDAEWQNWRMHNECYQSYADGSPQDGFMPGAAEMPERVKLLNGGYDD